MRFGLTAACLMVRFRLTAAWLPICLLAGCLSSTAGAEEPIEVFAAGSLTGALTAVMQLYKQEAGVDVTAEFGPAGLLLERIENGAMPDIFASANMAHPQTLAERGLATPPVVMARNRLCARTLPGFGLTGGNLLDRLLDSSVGLGTSTPGADPGGDYAWLMFARAERIRPGAQAILEAKAQQLVGGRRNPPVPAGKNAMQFFLEEHAIDISIGYCSSHERTSNPALTSVPLPADLAITADYGLSVLTNGKSDRSAALRFALFVMSPEAQRLISLYGFVPVTEATPALQ
jgi:ABC-type molybdate transport system substrate-binding protein